MELLGGDLAKGNQEVGTNEMMGKHQERQGTFLILWRIITTIAYLNRAWNLSKMMSKFCVFYLRESVESL